MIIKKAELKKYARELKISDIGVCSAEALREKTPPERNIDTPLMPKKDTETVNEIVSYAKSVIMCAFNYYYPSKAGSISFYARGLDYHSVVKTKLTALCEKIKNEHGDFKSYIFCDSSPFSEKYLAYMSGLGFIGDNHLLIHPDFGSYVFLGGIATDIEIEADKPLDTGCSHCGLCKKSCPGKVFDENAGFYNCVSYLTQKKGELDENEKASLKKSGRVWGCDICSMVCPHNKNAQKTDICEFLPTAEDIDEKYLESNKIFKEKYGGHAFSWRGKNVIKRNIDILKD